MMRGKLVDNRIDNKVDDKVDHEVDNEMKKDQHIWFSLFILLL